ncbi:hypothetical protein [Paracoccus alkanivorans]|uniref:Uncharacterized protein n=2 Tax=Pseudomonadota TaxID=1224 RepID=A0A3M0LVY8_9RHOB|nr:hypothetical protein [Paracoccus alkanivorans]RMC29672.1 hypothetical protein C9E81_22430 [Paracoccus alkanivorans]
MKPGKKLAVIFLMSTVLLVIFYAIKYYTMYDDNIEMIARMDRENDFTSDEMMRHFSRLSAFRSAEVALYSIFPITSMLIANIVINIKNTIAVLFISFFGVIMANFISPWTSLSMDAIRNYLVVATGYILAIAALEISRRLR